MSDDRDHPSNGHGGRLAPSGVMSHQRPLDALLPELRLGTSVPRSAVHPRVLEVEVEGHYEWVYAIWSDPGDPQQLHRELRRLIEASLLSELSQPPTELTRAPRAFHWLRLMVFADVRGVSEAVRAFGFEPVEYSEQHYIARMAALENEARALGWDVPERPLTVWQARIAHQSGALGEQLREIQGLMAARMGNDVWGRTPGAPSRLFAGYARQYFHERLRPTLAGLRAAEALLVQDAPRVVRWIDPLLFQALADFIAVVAQSVFEVPIAWAECVLDESGFAPPPLLRAERAGQPVHVPIGLHLLRWCVMPLEPGESVPSLSDWVVDQFAPEET